MRNDRLHYDDPPENWTIAAVVVILVAIASWLILAPLISWLRNICR